eukprot:scaffold625_cov324-Pavlova_lutheri.AAC.48
MVRCSQQTEPWDTQKAAILLAKASPLVHEDDHGDVVPNAMCSSLDLIEWDPQPYNDSLGQQIQF